MIQQRLNNHFANLLYAIRLLTNVEPKTAWERAVEKRRLADRLAQHRLRIGRRFPANFSFPEAFR